MPPHQLLQVPLSAKKETKEVATDISKHTVAELKKIEADKNITIQAGAKKADILELLK